MWHARVLDVEGEASGRIVSESRYQNALKDAIDSSRNMRYLGRKTEIKCGNAKANAWNDSAETDAEACKLGDRRGRSPRRPKER